MTREDRAAGAVIGLAVGDALGAPFEFGPPMAFSERFGAAGPAEAAQLCGGGGWDPGEATDDTQMALLVAESLLAHDGLDPADVFNRFQQWAAAEPKDIGLQTEIVLGSGLGWKAAAADHFATHGRAAGNGSLMRAATAAVFFAGHDRQATMDAARRISALTHGDPAAGEGCAVYHELIRIALDGGAPVGALPDILRDVASEHRDRWSRVLEPGWHPDQATESNGAVWPTLGSAVWALRRSATFADAVRLAVDLGGDTDTVAAVTGGLAGAVHGADGIPAAWRQRVFVPLPGFDTTWREADLRRLAARLLTRGSRRPSTSRR